MVSLIPPARIPMGGSNRWSRTAYLPQMTMLPNPDAQCYSIHAVSTWIMSICVIHRCKPIEPAGFCFDGKNRGAHYRRRQIHARWDSFKLYGQAQSVIQDHLQSIYREEERAAAAIPEEEERAAAKTRVVLTHRERKFYREEKSLYKNDEMTRNRATEASCSTNCAGKAV